MFHPENRHIESTNPIVRNFKSLQWVLIMMCATLLDPNQPSHYFTASTVRARERQIRAPKKHILRGLGRGSYPAHVTVYPYNGCIRGTNPVVRHVMSLTCTLKRMRANQRTPIHAATQPLHGSNTRAQAPNLWHGAWGPLELGAWSTCTLSCGMGRAILLTTATTDTL